MSNSNILSPKEEKQLEEGINDFLSGRIISEGEIEDATYDDIALDSTDRFSQKAEIQYPNNPNDPK